MSLKLLGVVGGVGVWCASALGGGGSGGLIQYPSVSPDGQTVVFSASGDLWAVGVDGGMATRLTVHPGVETRSFFSPDGKLIAFESNRDGAQNIYTMSISGVGADVVGGEIQRVTVSDRSEMLSGFSADGKSVLFSGSMYPKIYRHVSMFRAPIDGGAMELISDAFGRAPVERADGEWVYFNRGYYYPNRPAYRGPGNIDLWRMHKDGETFEQLTSFDGNDLNARPLADGSVVYVSSRDGQYNLYRLAKDSTDLSGAEAITQLTHFEVDEGEHTIGHGVRDLAVSGDGATAVFVVWDTLYALDLTNRGAEPRAIAVEMGADLARDRFERMDVSAKVGEAAVHPSGDAVAVAARGELFVRSTKEGRPTRRITDSAFREGEIVWSPDGSVLYFSSDTADGLGRIYSVEVTLSGEDIAFEDEPEEVGEEKPEEDEAADETVVDEDVSGEGEVGDDADAEVEVEKEVEAEAEEEKEKIDFGKRWSEALRFEVKTVVTGDGAVYAPNPSPNGKKLLYKRDRGDVVLLDLESGDERVLFASWSDPEVHWASDSRHVYYENSDLDFNSDIFILDTQLDEDGNAREAVNVSQHPDYDHSPRLSHDGKVLTFLSDRDNLNWSFDVYAVFLDESLEGMPGYALKEYFAEAAKAAKKLGPVDLDAEDEGEVLEFDADDAFLRIRRITSTPESESDLVMTPGGDRIAFSTVIDGKRSYVSVNYAGKERKSVYSGTVSDVRMGINGGAILLVASGQARSVSPTGGKVTTYGIRAKILVDRDAERMQKFHEAARRFGQSFYHPTIKGLDWDAMIERYGNLISQTHTKQSFQRVVNFLFGEVNGSHTGIWGGDGYSAASPGNGYLGIDFSVADGGYRIDAVLVGGAIDEMDDGPAVGDVIVAIDDRVLASEDTRSGVVDLHGSLAGLAGSEVLIEYVHTDEDGVVSTRFGMVTPSSYSAASVIRYQNEVMRRRAIVEERSGGRLGYLHIRSMGMASVREFERDLYAAAHGKDGLVIDVRDNGGGWTTDILLSSLTAPAHAYTIPRGANRDDVRFDSYPRDRRLIYAWSRPISVLINQHSFSNAEIFAHAIKTIGRGKIVGTQTYGGVISTGSFRLIDDTLVRRPFRGWYLPDGTDMENNGTMPDIRVSQTPTDEVRGIDRQLRAAIDAMLADLETP